MATLSKHPSPRELVLVAWLRQELKFSSFRQQVSERCSLCKLICLLIPVDANMSAHFLKDGGKALRVPQDELHFD